MNFNYKARDRYGKLVSGVMAGENEVAVAKHLSTMGYVPIDVAKAGGEASPVFAKFTSLFNKVAPEDMTMFTRQLLTLQRAGIPLLLSLNILEKQMKSKYFKDIIKEIAGRVEEGSTLSNALSKYPHIFSELYVNMVKAGEASGLLDEILERLAEFAEKDLDSRSKIKSAMRYPLITLGALCVAFFVVVTFVIPKFAGIFAQFKTELPLPTRILLGMNYVVKHYWYIIALVIGAAVFAFKKYINTPKGRLKWDSLTLRAPVFGQLMTLAAMSRFSRTMSILIRSGLPILQVLDMTSKTVGNALVAQTVDKIAASTREGKGISEPMRMSGIFPPIVVQMVAIGEDTGKIDELLMKVSDYYDQQADYMMKNLSTLIEPIFILLLGGMVLIMALAIFLPMWNLISVFKH